MKEWVIVVGVIVLMGVVLLAGYYWVSKSNGNDGDGTISSIEGCEAAGGQWGVYGTNNPTPQESCNLPTEDAGKTCTSSNQCNGSCIVSEGSNIGECNSVYTGCDECTAHGGTCSSDPEIGWTCDIQVNTSDGGRQCKDNNDCESNCVLSENIIGTCSERMIVLGCNDFVENGKINRLCAE